MKIEIEHLIIATFFYFYGWWVSGFKVREFLQKLLSKVRIIKIALQSQENKDKELNNEK